MKKQLLALSLFVMLLFGAASVNAQNGGYPNDNALIGQAIGAFRAQCDQNFSGQIGGNVETTSICFVNGYLKTVHLYPIIQCHQFPCPMILVIRLGSVDFDCDGNIVSVNCNNR